MMTGGVSRKRASLIRSEKSKLTELAGTSVATIFEDQGLGQRFLDKMSRQKDKIHQVDSITGTAETNGSVRSRSIQVATEMQTRGITQGDVVLISSKTHADQTVAVLATIIVGGIVAPVDTDLSLLELDLVVKILKPKMAFCDPRNLGQLETALRNGGVLSACKIVTFGRDYNERIKFDKLLDHKLEPEFRATTIKDIRHMTAFIVMSQNTTGPLKLVSLSHYAIQMQLTNCLETILKGVEKVLSFFPLSWIPQVLLTCLCYDAPIIRILAGEFSERSACRIIHDLRIDHAFLGTEYALRIANHSSREDFSLSNLRGVYVGGLPTPALQMAKLRKTLQNVKIYQCYGLTEMGCIVSGFSPDDYSIALEKPGSVGKLLPGNQIRIVDVDSREVRGPDWWGELLISGPCMMQGYYKDSVATHSIMEKGYIRTGDIAQYDRQGYLYIQGRVCDLILLDGHRIAPLELEEVVLAHNYVQEVAVIGDGKDLVVCVVLKTDYNLAADRLMEYIEERLPESKRPNKIEFFDSFPKTSVGKVRRKILKQNVLGVTIQHSKSVASVSS